MAKRLIPRTRKQGDVTDNTWKWWEDMAQRVTVRTSWFIAQHTAQSMDGDIIESRPLFGTSPAIR